jgi:small subunit ribosomal protein S3
VSRILIERPAKNARITIFSARPGVVIGKKGEDIENLKAELTRRLGCPVAVNIEEVRKPEIDAQLIADSITQQLEKRIMFRRAMKRAMQNAMRLGAQGIKLMSAGRLNGIEIARTEWYREGRVPLHTLKADIDYGFSEAKTTYGVIGVKCWVYRGDRLANGEAPNINTPAGADDDRRNRRGPRPGGPGAPGGRPRSAAVPAAAAGSRPARSRRRTRPGGNLRGGAEGGRGRRRAWRRRTEDTRSQARPQGRRTASGGGRQERQRRVIMLQPARRKFRKEQKGRNTGVATRGANVSFGDFGLKSVERGPPHGAPDRGGAPGDLASREARRPDLDPHLSGQARVAEAGRGPHGERQGEPGVLRRRDPARQGALRNQRRAGTARARGVPARFGQAAAQDHVRGAPGRRLRAGRNQS